MKKVLSVLLALCLVVGVLPVLVSAKGINRYEAVLNQLIAERQGSKSGNAGIYYDINGDGIEEMLIIRQKKDTNGFSSVNASLYTVVDGVAECLLKDEELYIDVGGPSAAFQVVTKNGQTYLAIMTEGGETSGIHFRRRGTWRLFAMDSATDTLKKKSDVTYTVWRGYTHNDNKVYQSESFAVIDGKRVSWNAFEAWEKSLSVKAQVDVGMGAIFSKTNQTFEQLLRKAKEDTTGDLPITSVAGFKDVKVGAFYADSVAWALEKGITSGTAKDKFGVGSPCKREQIATFLWRANNSPEASQTAGFADMTNNQVFNKAISWAVENGITSGVGNNKFGVGQTCTRVQAVTFLWVAAGKPTPTKQAAFDDMTNNPAFNNAISWAVENGITSGTGGNKFSPNKACTREQIVTFLYKAYN
ncbi:MAG: S-layer homology domain-containing protein [Acutalibacter sp.]|nr:S-layer homology domain-containing protein [Acutalibacter sp.]